MDISAVFALIFLITSIALAFRVAYLNRMCRELVAALRKVDENESPSASAEGEDIDSGGGSD